MDSNWDNSPSSVSGGGVEDVRPDRRARSVLVLKGSAAEPRLRRRTARSGPRFFSGRPVDLGFGPTAKARYRSDVSRHMDSREQQLQVLALQIADQAVIFSKDGVGQLPLRLLELQHFFFHRVAGNQPVCEYRPRLADAVRAIHGLSLHGRVPPRVQKEHVLG